MENPVNYKEGYELSMANAKSHLKVAEFAASNCNYGIGNAHVILASEEAIKAYTCYARFYDPNIEIKNFNEYFNDHKTKHKSMRDMLSFMEFLKQSVMVSLAPAKRLLKEKKEDYTVDELIASRKQGTQDLIKWLGTIPKMDANDKWWNEANNNRNAGFYVNLINNKWHSPMSVKESEYKKSLKIVTEVIEYMEMVPSIENDPEAQANYEKIRKIQEDSK